MKFLRFVFTLLVRTVEVVGGLLLAAILLPCLFSVPGCARFHRYASYESLREMAAAETNDIRKIVPFRQDGSNFTAVVVRPCRCLASGPAVLIYDQEGTLVDRCLDIGDYGYRSGRCREEWNFSPWGSWTDASTP